jgi:hypothetical protein
MIVLGQRASELAHRREQLLARSAAGRELLAYELVQWGRPRRIIDRAITVFMYVRAHPAILAIGIAAVVAIQRRGWWGWVSRGVAAWRLVRTLRNFSFKANA